MVNDDEVRQWLADYAARTDEPKDLEYLITLIENETFPAVPPLFEDEVARIEMQTIIRAHAQDFLAALRGDLSSSYAPKETLDWARAVARRGHGLSVVLAAYRAGQRALLNFVKSTVEQRVSDVDLQNAVQAALWDRATLWSDTTMDAMVATYSEELEQWQRGASGDRLAAIQAILRGDVASLEQMSNVVGHALHLHQTAVVLWAEEEHPNVERRGVLDEVVNDLATTLGGGRPLTLAAGEGGLLAWIATSGVPDPNVLIDEALPVGVRVAAGSAWPGLVGFRRSHREALEAQRVAVTGRKDRQVTRYEDVELVCFATGGGSIDASRALVSRELKGLAAPGRTLARLRNTARVFLSCGENAVRTGELLSIQPVTVRHRIQQVEQLIGHPIDRRRSHIELALQCVEEFGEQVMPVQGAS